MKKILMMLVMAVCALGAMAQDAVFENPEVQPEFPGGQSALMAFLSKNLKYPKAAMEAGIQGRVLVQFVIDAEGNVVEPKVYRGVDAELDTEALRVVKAMPKWKPGLVDNKAVRTRFTMPINFRLNADKPAGAPAGGMGGPGVMGRSGMGGPGGRGGMNAGLPMARPIFAFGDTYLGWERRKNVDMTGSSMWKKVLVSHCEERAAAFLKKAFADYPDDLLAADAKRVVEEFGVVAEWRLAHVVAQNKEDYTKFVDIQLDEYMKWRAISPKFSAMVVELQDILKTSDYLKQSSESNQVVDNISVAVFSQLLGNNYHTWHEKGMLKAASDAYKQHYFVFDLARGILPYVVKGVIDKDLLVSLSASGDKEQMVKTIDDALKGAGSSAGALVQKNMMTWIVCNVAEVNDATTNAVMPKPNTEKVFSGMVGMVY